jgi:YTH domain-containing family protein
VLSKSDSVVMDKIITETYSLIEKIQNLNLEKNRTSWQDFGYLASLASTRNRKKECYPCGTQARGKKNKDIVKATQSLTREYHPKAPPNQKSASDGQQRCWKKVEVAPTEKPQPETVASASSKAAPEGHQQGGKTVKVPWRTVHQEILR